VCRALTCDSEGSFRLWAIEKSVGSRAVCLGLFDAHTTLSTLKVYLYTHMYIKIYHIPYDVIGKCYIDQKDWWAREHPHMYRYTLCGPCHFYPAFSDNILPLNVLCKQPRSFTVCWDMSLVLSANGLSLLESHRTRRKEVGPSSSNSTPTPHPACSSFYIFE
jgi:hypothetical protein